MIAKCRRCNKKYERSDIGGYGLPNLCPKCLKESKAKGISYILMSLVLVFTLLLLCSSVQAQQTFKQNDLVDIKVQCINNGTFCASGSCNITFAYPNNSIYVNNQLMTNQNSFYNYTLSDSSIMGDYPCSVTCCDGSTCGTNQDCSFQITGNGKSNPDGIVVVLFILFFIIIMAFLVFMLIYSIGHIIRLDFDLMDLSYNLGIYFVMLTLYFLSQFYLGNPTFESILLLIIQVGAVTHVFVPFIAFIINITVGAMQRKKNNFGQPPRMPMGRRFYG